MDAKRDFAALVAGAYVHGALALAGLFVLALVHGDKVTALMAIFSAGFAYLAQVCAAGNAMKLNGIAAGVSILVGIAAFLRLAI